MIYRMSHLALWYCPKDTDDANRQHNLLMTISYHPCHCSNRHGVGASLNYLERQIPNKSGKCVDLPKVKVKELCLELRRVTITCFSNVLVNRLLRSMSPMLKDSSWKGLLIWTKISVQLKADKKHME